MQPNGTPSPRKTGRPRGPRVTITCVVCGTLKELQPSRIKRGEKVCSRTCAGVITRGPRRSFVTAFWKKVDKSGECWLWTASLTSDGYGRVGMGTELKLAHRVSWEMENGPIPDGLQVRHRCPGGPNRACVRPIHLLTGTVQQNMDDRRADGHNLGRGLPGEGNAMAKLTADQVADIRRLHATRQYIHRELGAMFGVHPTTIGNIVRGERWRNHETKL